MQIHLNTYGTYLHVKDDLFEIKIPREEGPNKQQIAAHKVKSIWIAKGIALSSDAVHLAMRHNVDIVFLEHSGHPVARVWHSKLGSTTLIRKRQLEASLGPAAAQYTKTWLTRKLENQANFIRDLLRHRKTQEAFLKEKIERIDKLREAIAVLEGEDVRAIAETLRGLEGTAGRLYFETLSAVLPEQYRFAGRSFRPALDPFNAMLNYAYGILYSQVEKSLIIAGIDPFVGFLHRDDYNHRSMVYDFIEPYRVWADKAVFQLFSTKKVKQEHTKALSKGVGLEKEGKVLAVEAFNARMEGEKIRFRQRHLTRLHVLQLEAHQLANELLGIR